MGTVSDTVRVICPSLTWAVTERAPRTRHAQAARARPPAVAGAHKGAGQGPRPNSATRRGRGARPKEAAATLLLLLPQEDGRAPVLSGRGQEAAGRCPGTGPCGTETGTTRGRWGGTRLQEAAGGQRKLPSEPGQSLRSSAGEPWKSQWGFILKGD